MLLLIGLSLHKNKRPSIDPMFSLPTIASSHFRTMSRAISLLAHGLSLLIFHHTQPWAAKAYNDLCASQGMTFGAGPSMKALALTMAVVSVPLLLARSNMLIATNLVASLITAIGAAGLLVTAGNTPFECFSVAGHYNDRTSGLEGFDFWEFFMISLSYIFLLIDLTVWGVRRVIAFRVGSSSA
jgi:hypothetical protein